MYALANHYNPNVREFIPIYSPGVGLGVLSQQNAQIAGMVSSGMATTTSMLVALGTITGPVGIAIAGLISIGTAIASLFGGCGNTCVEATNIANQAGAQIDQAFYTYMASPIHYASMQAAYLNLFDTTWAGMVAACQNPALGSAGVNCISDRQRGSCAYHTSPGGWQQGANGQWEYVDYGANGSGSTCWNSFVGRRDPVANDPTVVSDPTPTSEISNVVSSLLPNASGGGMSLLLIAGLAIGGIFVMSES